MVRAKEEVEEERDVSPDSRRLGQEDKEGNMGWRESEGSNGRED